MHVIRGKKILIIVTLCICAAVSPALFNNDHVKDTTLAAVDDRGNDAGEVLMPLTWQRQLVAENDQYRLFMDEAIGHVTVEHKASDHVWYSAPRVEDDWSSNVVKTVLNPLSIRYTEGGTSFSTLNPLDEEARITASAIEQGMRLDYEMAEAGLALAVEYRLVPTGLELTIPFTSIKETGSKRIVSIEPNPYFEAASPDSDGALFMPDGSGAIMTYKTERPVYHESFNEFIYGGDQAFKKNMYQRVTNITIENTVPQPKERVSLPVFGLYKDGKGFLGIVTEGDADAMIRAVPAGVRNIDLYRTSVNFIYRNDDITFIGSSGEIAMIERHLIAGDRTIRYMFQTDDAADYVGMAQSYRHYLMTDKGLRPNEQAPRFQLRLLGGAERHNVIGKTFITMTTFNEAQQIIDHFIAHGLGDIEVTYDGWSSGGQFGNQPKHFPTARQLGGNKDLEQLATYLQERQIPLYLSANYVKSYSESKALRPRRDAIYGINKEVVTTPLPYRDTRQMSQHTFYYLKPGRMFERFIESESAKFDSIGVGGVHLQYMGDTVYSDHQQDEPYRRLDTIRTWQETFDLMRQVTGFAATDYGFAYTLGHIDRLDNIPMDASHYYYQDRAVPFYQIAIHGLVPYTADPSNLADDPRLHLLKLLEYGALPSYELTYERSTLLKETLAHRLLSSQYEDWQEEVIADYEVLMALLTDVHDQFIVNHEMLAPHVFRTTYENNTQIIVNYDRESRQAAGHMIEPYSYVIIAGGEER